MLVVGRYLSILALALAVTLPPQSALGQADIFFNLMGRAIEQGVRQQQIDESRRREQGERERRANAEREREIALIRQVQTNLQRLGFYNMRVDGSYGPGTQAAVTAFQRAFKLKVGQMTQDQISYLAQVVESGYRSAEDYRAGTNAGFSSRADWEAARRGGFPDAQSVREAREQGIPDYETFREYRSSGFGNFRDFRGAREQGFVKRVSYEEARRLGLSSQSDLDAFRKSKFVSAEEFLRERAREQERAAIVENCRTLYAGRQWLEAASACHAAMAVAPSDTVVQVAHATVSRQLSALEDAARVELVRIETALSAAQAKDGPQAKAAQELVDQAAESEATIGRIRQVRLASQCMEASAANRWREALEACSEAVDASPDNPEMVARLREAQGKLGEEERQAVAERDRLALVNARAGARALIADIEDYASNGGRFASGLDLARALLALKNVSDSPEVEVIGQARASLAEILQAEGDFEAYVARKTQVGNAARAEAALAARANAERLDGFIKDHIARNILSPHMEVLLRLQENLSRAIAKDDLDGVVAAQKFASDSLGEIGLASEARAFVLRPAERAEQLRTDAAASETRRLELDGVVRQSRELISSIEDYLSSGAGFVEALPVARGLNALKNSLATPEAGPIEEARAALSGIVVREQGYAQHVERRNRAAAVARANALVTARARAGQLDAFVQSHIAANTLSPHLAELLDLQDRLSAALASGDLDDIVNAQQVATSTLQALALTSAAEDFARRSAEAPDLDLERSESGFVISASNAALLSGDARDIVVLHNLTASAPHLARNILGDLVFDGGVARACWYHAPPAVSLPVKLMRRSLAERGIDHIQGGRRCGTTEIARQDLVLLQRGDFLGSDPLYAKPLIDAFEDGTLLHLETLEWAQLEARETEMAALADTILRDIADKAREGFGFILLDGGSNNLCVVETADMPSHMALLASRQDDVSLHIANASRMSDATLDRTFIRVQRDQCAALYAARDDLETVLGALARERIAHAVVPLWFTPDDIAQSAAALAEAELAATRSRQERVSQAALEREKRETAETIRLRRQEELRDRYSQEARAAFNDLSADIRLLIEEGILRTGLEGQEGEEKEGQEKENGDAAGGGNDGHAGRERARILAELFPRLTEWRERHVGDQWEIDAVDSEMRDFGTGVWKERRAEAVFARVQVDSKNRTLGDYRRHCFLVGYLVDAEFGLQRDPLEASCDDDEAGLVAWKIGHAFESRWWAQVE
jgi:hypothetical protein